MLLLIVSDPVPDLYIPNKEVASVAFAEAVVIAPIVFPEQLPFAKLIPINLPSVAPFVREIDAVPVAAPIILAVVVPILTSVPSLTIIPYHDAFEALLQLKFFMVFPCILFLPVAVVNEIALKTLSKALVLVNVPPHCAEEPPMKLLEIVKLFPFPLAIFI